MPPRRRGARPVQQAQRDPTRDTRAHNVNQVPGPNPGPHHPPAAALDFPANANALAATALAATGIITSTIAFTGGQQAQVQAQAQQPPIISPQAIRFIANAAAGHQGLADALNTFASLNNRAVAAAYINNSAATNGVVDRSLRHFGFLNNVAAHFQQAANPNDPRSVQLRAAAFYLDLLAAKQVRALHHCSSERSGFVSKHSIAKPVMRRGRIGIHFEMLSILPTQLLVIICR